VRLQAGGAAVGSSQVVAVVVMVMVMVSIGPLPARVPDRLL